jgi:DNA-binding response OmpR family regulator
MRGKNKKILVVEDDRDLAELTKITLSEEGYNVDLQYNGKKALAYIEKNYTKEDQIALIILDLYLPGMYGLEVLRELRRSKNAYLQKVPIIILSVLSKYDIRKDLDYLIEQGIFIDEDAILRKPCTMKELIDNVHQLISKTFT